MGGIRSKESPLDLPTWGRLLTSPNVNIRREACGRVGAGTSMECVGVRWMGGEETEILMMDCSFQEFS